MTKSHIGCPLYRSAREANPWQSEQAHAGLIFDKFGNAWRKTEKGKTVEYGFDKGDERKKETAGQWLKKFTEKKVGEPGQLETAARRQRELVQAIGGFTVALTNETRFVTGMGRQHPKENGFTWHPTLGTPYLPGTSLKGVLRSYYLETKGDWNEQRERFEETDDIKTMFGVMEHVGDIITFDLLPLEPVQLVTEIMTPHYGPYYQDDKGQTVPGDWLSPVPITYLAVEVGRTWQAAIAPRPGCSTSMSELRTELLDALQDLGIGAKTNIGMGRFEYSIRAEELIVKKDDAVQEQKEKEKTRAAEAKLHEQAKANASPEKQELLDLQRAQQWEASAQDSRMIDSLTEFAHRHDTLPDDCLEWIQEFIESIPKYKGVWKEPEVLGGKKKNKWKYGSEKIRELVKTLNGSETSDS